MFIKNFNMILNFNIKICFLITVSLIFLPKCISQSKIEVRDLQSVFGFKFLVPNNYVHINNVNFTDILNNSNLENKAKNLALKFNSELKNQKLDILFKEDFPINNLTIIKYNTEEFNINKNNVKKFCQNILDKEKVVGKINSQIIECKMIKIPKFANWSSFRESNSSFVKNIITQQVIFYFKGAEYNVTTNCTSEKNCTESRLRLFNLIQSFEF